MASIRALGSIRYLVEGQNSGFTRIPRSVYWAIITLTTLGYGDILPQSNLRQMIDAAVMIMGYTIIAVPTGIYSTELLKAYRETNNTACIGCGAEGHNNHACFCIFCGQTL